MSKIWLIDRLPSAIDDGPIIEVGLGWPRVEVVGAGEYLSPPAGPVEIVWKRAFAKMGDFCWPIMQHSPAVKLKTAEELKSHLEGFSLVDVQYIKDFNLTTPPPFERVFDKKPILKFLFTTHCVSADEEKSSIVHGPVEDAPDQIGVYVEGIEERKSIQNPAFSGSWQVRTIARKPGYGLFIHKRDIEGFDFFRINQNRRSSYCTDRARDFILDRSYTGIDFLEAGEVI